MTSKPIVLTGAQSRIAKDDHRFRVVCCGRRFGKTTLAILEMIGWAVSENDRNVCYIAPTHQQARDIAWQELKKACQGAIEDINETRLEIKLRTRHGGISSLWLRGWEAIETLRGQRFDFVVVDEIAMMRNWDENWQEVIRPTLTDSKGHALFISTPKGFNHLYELYLNENNDKDYKSFHFTSYDNPNIPVEELNKAKTEITEDRFAQEYLADFRKTEGLVYKEFDRTKHLFEDKDLFTVDKTIRANIIERMAGVDFGFTNPTAILEIWRDSDDHYWVISEWYKTGKTNSEIIEYLKTLRINMVYPDPAEPDRIMEMDRAGINCRDVSKDVEKGIDSVRNLLKNGRIKIHNKCYNLIQEIESYSYKEKRPGQNEPEEPIKENDHACFVTGTIVDGNLIEKVGILMGVENVFTYQIGESEVTATPNHPVCTHRGFIHIDALRYNDIIWQSEKLLFLTVSNGLDIQIVLHGLKGITISAVRRLLKARERDFIATSIVQRLAPSKMVFIFITLMAIPAITKLIIWLVLTAMNTLLLIGQKRSVSLLKGISEKLYQLLQNGLRPVLAGSIDHEWENKMPIICSNARSSNDGVTYAKGGILQKEMGETDSVTTTAVKKHYVGPVPVYNLVTKNGMYCANGIMVSNCDALRYTLFMQQPVQYIQPRKRIMKFEGNMTY